MAEPSDTAPELKTVPPDKPFKKRIAHLDEYYDVRTFSTKLRKSAKQQKEREHKYAIIIRRLIDDRGRHYDTVIDIKSARLCNVLLDINKGVEDLALSRKEPEATQELMYYSYPGLLERLAIEQKQEEKDELLIGDLQTGKLYVDEYMGDTMKDVSQMLSHREISFDAVWALFYPNSLVYSYHTNTDQDTVLIVRRSSYDERRSEVKKDGTSLFENETEPFFVNGRVMISPLAYARFHSTISPTVHRALKKDSLTDDQYAMCSPILMGFAFDHKIWGEFALTRARNVDWNDAAFDALVLGQKQKKLIYSLVRQHAKKGANFDDIIKGKGQGLIGLLSGTPGCGKTLTAEAVAEVTHKPLYVLSAGELGITPTSLESSLVRALEFAQMWDAVLLLDEAEVFLTQRNSSDLERNALVSIFLRRLEYYQGILILTTNMPENRDPAFESRIHFSVNYPELDVDSRKIIWAMFFKRSSTDTSDEELCHLTSYPINGRQIKNFFSSALTIGRADDSPPGALLKDIHLVLNVLNDWKKGTQKRRAVD